MKRIFAAMVVFVLLATLSFNTAFAAPETYVLDDLGLQVVIPSGYSVITRDTLATAEIFNRLTMSKAELDSMFVASNIYLNAISDTHNEEVIVRMSESLLDDFHILSDAVLNMLMSLAVEQWEASGLDVIKYDIYHHTQAKFVRIVFEEEANAAFGVQYYTTYDGKTYNFTIRSYTGDLTAKQENVIQAIVDSVIFDKAPSGVEPSITADTFVYTNNETGVTFTVPANWQQEDLSKEREILSVKFVSTEDIGCNILFGYVDVWAQMPLLDRLLTPRSSLNNSSMTKAEIAEEFGTTIDKVALVKYHGIDYYQCEMTGIVEKYGIPFPVTITMLVHCENGWMYIFQFSGQTNDALYGDFEKLLESVHIPGSN